MAEDTGYAEGTGALVLFGGYNGTSYLGDTWTYTATGWTKQTPTASPSARAYAAMAYNGTLAEPDLFGGYDGTTVLGDTWEYTGTNNWVTVPDDQSLRPGSTPPWPTTPPTASWSCSAARPRRRPPRSSTTPGPSTPPPDAPTGVTATRRQRPGHGDLQRRALLRDGGYTITSYTVTASGDQTCTVTPGTGTPPATYDCTVTGLTNGTSYTFTVTSTNFQGTGLPSTASTAVVPSTVPGAPTIGTATGGNGQASVAFTAPASNGGSAITPTP